MIVVRIEKVDLMKIPLPAELYTIRTEDGDEIVEFLFDTDNENSVKDSMKILIKLFPKHEQKFMRKVVKEKHLKDLGITPKKE